jgi:hypothetical protein
MPGPINANEQSSQSIRIGKSSIDRSRKKSFWKNPLSLFKRDSGQYRKMATMIGGMILLASFAIAGLFINRDYQRTRRDATPDAQDMPRQRDRLEPTTQQRNFMMDLKMPWKSAAEQRQSAEGANPEPPVEKAKTTKKELPAATKGAETGDKPVAAPPVEIAVTPKRESPSAKIAMANGERPRPDETHSPSGPVSRIADPARKPKNDAAGKLADTVKP